MTRLDWLYVEDYEIGLRVQKQDRRVIVDMIYPQLDNVNEVEVGLEDVRAADSILVRYDFDRDGWSIFQASTFEWEADDKEYDQDWQEVAFVQVWGRKKEKPVHKIAIQQEREAKVEGDCSL